MRLSGRYVAEIPPRTRGIGFLYVADRTLAAGAYPLLVDMHGATWTDPGPLRAHPDARRFESWEIAYALALGLGAAARYALDTVGIETARDRSHSLAAYARERCPTCQGCGYSTGAGRSAPS